MMDNRIFNVNGNGRQMLADTLKLAFIQEGFVDRPATAKGWIIIPDKGLLLLWAEPDGEAKAKFNKFPVELDAEACGEMAFKWLESDEAKAMPCTDWDADADHDGSNRYGWRVYVEDWGHVAHNRYTICAVRPSYNWLGK